MSVAEEIDKALAGTRPSKIIACTIAALLCGNLLNKALNRGNLIRRGFLLTMSGIRSLAKSYIRDKVLQASKDIQLKTKEGICKTYKLLPEGKSFNEVLEILREFHTDLDMPYEEGQLSGAVYHGSKDHSDFVNEVLSMFQWSNPLHSDVFGATRKMEAEIVSMVVHMFNGHLLPDACGALTSGGSESIMMAMKTCRDWGRANRSIQRPSVVVPITIHPAFDKAAEYFDIYLIKVPVNPTTMTVVAAELEKYIRYDTIAIVGSACSFPHGAIDPIEELSNIAVKHNLLMHVDSCLGGFILPFLHATGRSVPIIDFRLPGVTSISCDTHKYGYGPKGTSTVLYRSKSLRYFQFCSVSDWPGGMYCSPSVSGSKPGNVIAATWAVMMHMGFKGYVENADKIVTTREYMTSELLKSPYITVFGEPQSSVFAFGSDYFDIFELGVELSHRGWMLNRLQFPSGLQFSVTLLQTRPGVAEKFVSDVKELSEKLFLAEKKFMKENNLLKPRTGAHGGTMYGSAQRIPDRTTIQDVLKEYLNVYYTP